MAINKMLPLAPRPHQDEIISSWIARIASVYGASLAELLYDLRWEGEDVDYQPKHRDLQRLSKATHYPVDQIKLLSLKQRYPFSSINDFYRFAEKRFVLPVYCKECFLEDLSKNRQPYWRYRWASVWNPICPIHNLPLSEGCESMSCFLTFFMSDRYGPLDPCQYCPNKQLFREKAAEYVDLSSYIKQMKLNPKILKNYSENVDAELVLFQQAIERLFKQYRLASFWWLWNDPKSFYRVMTDIAPFLLLRQEAYDLRVSNPAQEIMEYSGDKVNLGRGKGGNKYSPQILQYAEEKKRYPALRALARLMFNPRKYCFVRHKYYGYELPQVSDIFSVFLLYLSNENIEILIEKSRNWPEMAHKRMDKCIDESVRLIELLR